MSRANDTIFSVGKKLEGDVINLSPGKVYHLRVLAFSKGGDGRMSSPTHTFQMGDSSLFRNSAVTVQWNFALLLVTLLTIGNYIRS